ncbi:hypothetical protein BLNAU_19 [Blattamonas nauphoetae]|uniref:Uncharacterized protein n=1 Tax=Blattamonas nauphoetae TaxID=2049346 RepID=A0ABQ9YLT8_9EUKA|nr:hypothetical protein BLNAU_19 [Blattamonas nauphoetae]
MTLQALMTKQVQAIANHPIGSAEWSLMAKHVKRLSTIALMENRIPLRKGESLFETTRFAVRHLIDDSKTSACLEAMTTVFAWKVESKKNPSIIGTTATTHKLPADELLRRVDIFEQSMGMILFCVFNCVETFAGLVDVGLANHIHTVYESVEKFPEIYTKSNPLVKSQAIMSFLYIYEIFHDEEKQFSDTAFFEALVNKGTLPLMMTFLSRHHATIPPPHLKFCLDSLSLLCGHELFNPREQFKSESCKTAANTMAEAFYDKYIKDNPGRIAPLHPLTKLINSCK